MPLVEFEVLLKLWLGGGRLRMSELADVALLSRSGLTRIVDELEGLGLVTREPDEHDGRVLLATITPLGDAACAPRARPTSATSTACSRPSHRGAATVPGRQLAGDPLRPGVNRANEGRSTSPHRCSPFLIEHRTGSHVRRSGAVGSDAERRSRRVGLPSIHDSRESAGTGRPAGGIPPHDGRAAVCPQPPAPLWAPPADLRPPGVPAVPLLPSLAQALGSLERVSWLWLLAALGLETLSEIGYVVAWRRIVDPGRVLEQEGRGRGSTPASPGRSWAVACWSRRAPSLGSAPERSCCTGAACR